MRDQLAFLTMSGICLSILGATPIASGHGLMQDPPARNFYCGYVTKPHEVANGVAEYPECEGAFADDFSGGYNFMSVLTHAEGRAVVSPLPQNVCGFDSETFDFGITPWDQPIDWPTTNMSAGENKITWNISWGPHFDDTNDFRYWITKPDFVFQVGVPLSWDDFETQPFCSLKYDHANPEANPDIQANVPEATFDTYCDVPQRSGRHVIYGEWGRNLFTFERFHGCIDAVFETDVLDSDNDGVADAQDNCSIISNGTQLDSDADGFGNACDPDLNNDNTVNFQDVALWTPFFGTDQISIADFDGNGVVNFIDYSILTGWFLGAPGPSGLVNQ